MVPWGLIATGVATFVVPQHKGVILIIGAALNVIKPKKNGQLNHTAALDTETLRSGKVKKVLLEWKEVDCKLLDKKGKEKRALLKKVSGAAQPGRLLAIMGPSGSGKTTLLNTLASQVPKSKNLSLTGELLVNGQPHTSTTYRQAYIRQEDIFFSQLTVRETLLTAGKLQLPRSMSEEDQEVYIEALIQRLGLVNCADTNVGDAKTRGISGGEKKRLAIACELISRPSVIFADEPTTGLDAFQAERVMSTLRSLAVEGHTVVASIHQPRGSIFALFDDLVLMSEGQLVYAGPAGDEAISYFTELGHKCPEHYNPAEFFADLISIDFTSPETELASRLRLSGLVAKFADRRRMEVLVLPDEEAGQGALSPQRRNGSGVGGLRADWWGQFKLLLRRSWRQAIRDKATNFVRGAMNISSALIFGSVFWRMGMGQTSIQDRMGLLQVAAINTAMASLTKTLGVFPNEKTIVQRERSKGDYNLAPYFAAKLLAELPISAIFPLVFGCIMYPMTGLHRTLRRFAQFLGIVTVESFTASAFGLMIGSIVPTTEAAMALGPAVMTVFIVFGGYYINAENTPKVFRWIPNVSLIRWGFQALTLNEFRGLEFEATKITDASTGEQVLERLSFADASIWQALRAEAKVLAALYYLTYYLLRNKQPRFQELKPPATVQLKELPGAASTST